MLAARPEARCGRRPARGPAKVYRGARPARAAVLYSFELVMLGVIVLGAMAACAFAVIRRRRREGAEAAAAAAAGGGAAKP